MFVHQVKIAVGQDQADIDPGIGHKKVPDHRQDQKASKGHRSGHDQLTTRRMIFAGRCPFCLINIVQDTPCGGEIGRTGISQGELAGGSRQQFCTEMGFQLCNLPADRGQGDAEHPAGAGKTPAVDHLHDNGHGFETVHFYSIYWKRISRL